MSTAQTNTYQCDDCGFKYEPRDFDGRDVSEQPDDFVCPACQASKDHFQVFIPPPDDLQGEGQDEEDAPETLAAGLPSEAGTASGVELRRVYTDTGDQSVSSLKELYDENDLDIQPDFQRYVVWTPTLQSRLIESVLLGLPIPRLYFAENDDETQVVVDGQQRLAALFGFIDGRYALNNLKALPALNGLHYRELDKKLRNRIKTFKLSTVLIQKESETALRFDLYERLNTGSVALNDQELRNSVYRGPYHRFIYGLADYPEWRKLLNLKERHKRMADAELVLRFMAFRDQTYNNFPDKSVKDFLNSQMELGRTYDQGKMKKAERDFKQAVQLTASVFGDKAFRKFTAGDDVEPWGQWERRRVLAVADVELWGFTKFRKNAVMARADAIRDAAIELMADPTFSDLVTNNTSATTRVERRFRMWKEMLDRVIGSSTGGPRLFDRKTKEQLFAADQTCHICKQKIQEIDDAHVDHVEPYAKGGRTKRENAALAHRFCNWSKGSGARVSA